MPPDKSQETKAPGQLLKRNSTTARHGWAFASYADSNVALKADEYLKSEILDSIGPMCTSWTRASATSSFAWTIASSSTAPPPA